MIKVGNRKVGSSYVEVIMLIVLCTIIVTGVLKALAFTASAERKENVGLRSGMLMSDIYEEIKGLSNSEFQAFLRSMKEGREYDLLYEVNEITQIGDKSKFMVEGEELNTFKVYQKRGDEIFLKVSFPGIDYDEESMGMGVDYEILGERTQNRDKWITEKTCDHALLIEEGIDERGYYANIIKRSTDEKFKFFIEEESPSVDIILDNEGISILCNDSLRYSEILSAEETSIFIKETLERKVNFNLKNFSHSKVLNSYVEQSDDTINNNFNIYGDRIEVHRNDTIKNPLGESYKFTMISRMRIDIFSFEDRVLVKIEDLDGYKKFERFGQ